MLGCATEIQYIHLFCLTEPAFVQQSVLIFHLELMENYKQTDREFLNSNCTETIMIQPNDDTNETTPCGCKTRNTKISTKLTKI